MDGLRAVRQLDRNVGHRMKISLGLRPPRDRGLNLRHVLPEMKCLLQNPALLLV